MKRCVILIGTQRGQRRNEEGYMRIYGIFRKDDQGFEPVRVFAYYKIGGVTPRIQANQYQLYGPEFVVVRLSVKWLRDHRQYACCRILLRSL